ncbi:hypothetical protein Pelo_6884 [Pelomyxa schiedti]|nr:hypothetical protein Pelo_6884 [Pelomyxa schiedti]
MTAASSTTTRQMGLSRAVMVSRVVWDSVVAWLVPEMSGMREAPLPLKHAVALCVVGEAMFPLRGLVRRALVARTPNKWYSALLAAAEAASTSCVDWLIASRRRTTKDDGGGEEEAAEPQRAGEGEGEGEASVMCRRERMTMRGMRRRENKEFLCVLGGLCVGGHLAEAQRLVGGGWHGLTWKGVDGSDLDLAVGGSGTEGNWNGRDRDSGAIQELSDRVRETEILMGVCERGWIDVAKWLVQRFGIREPWEFVQPLEGALEWGHLELAQWMVGTFDLVGRFTSYETTIGLDLHSKACMGASPSLGFMSCIWGKSSSLEVCQYVRKHLEVPFPPGPMECRYVRRLDVLKWILSEFDMVPTSEMVETLCGRREGLEFVKFFVEGNSITATPSLFLAACKAFHQSTQLVKWLSTKVELSKADLGNSFVTALAHGNTAIASWLEDSHHILDQYQGAAAAGKLLVRVCGVMPVYRDVGLEWPMCHLNFKGIHPSETGLVVDCVGELLRNPKSTSAALLLLEKFPMIPERERSELLTLALRECIHHGDSLPQVKRIVSMMDSGHGFTKDNVARCLSSATSGVSSKTVRWLVTQFKLEREHITLENNSILRTLISFGKECCAEWLINKFDITLEEVLMLSWGSLSGFDLATWQMIVEVFPAITAAHIKEKFLKLVCHSPVIARFTLRHFPDVKMEDIAGLCNISGGYFLRCWLIDNNLHVP